MAWVKRLLVLCTILLLGLAGWLWLTMLSPWFYERPDDLADIEQRTHQVFVYGTLRYAPVRWVVMGGSGDPEPATLEDHQRNGLDLSPSPGSQVKGLRLSVTADQLARLDRYERLGVRYERVEKQLADSTRAWVYQRLPNAQGMRLALPAAHIALVP
ncbi:gamma-glutamylcyclotransferase [Halomonas janggokensis]|uniref:Gamma-glutamylcyclotransferase n=1 Tax=Vreelandella janggokensis TaxID=370767 RepID=A0ABT4IT18_9GAMM|nr:MULTISPECIES: gamma-glutamylcyclotransferase family protein [Halomonas]MCZ0926378.1 gamma-glutamylcyclotransferase [Halomonas janggokensis]MCZ0928916.1 gamma-glutamylcyclotransferase [Halomonas janggokensis]